MTATFFCDAGNDGVSIVPRGLLERGVNRVSTTSRKVVKAAGCNYRDGKFYPKE